MTWSRWVTSLALAAAVHVPAQAQATAGAAFDDTERRHILAMGPWPPPAQRDASNRVEARPAAVALGRRLFFDPALSRDGRLSCASCHLPAKAFQDGQPTARARGAGLRNTPSLLDVADQRWFGWDGARDSLWAASIAPLLDGSEMAREPAELAAALRGDRRFAADYRRAFGAAPPTEPEHLLADLGKALAAYQATLRSPRTPFDDFRDALARGDLRAMAAYPASAARGLKLFIGPAGCVACHAGPGLTNREFADIGRPFFVPGGVDPGRHGGLAKLRGSGFNRLGRHNDAGPGGQGDPRAVLTRHVAPQHRHFGEFRVPGLRQLLHTAPYMHDGSLATLHDVVRHYSLLDEERLHADGERILRRLDLDEAQVDELVAFLRSLSSPSLAPR